MDYVFETDALTKTYGAHKAVNNLSMHIKKGDIYGFVGKNGAGKTTVIRLITGLIYPTAGKFTLYGASDRAGLSQARRRIAAVVETPSVYLNLSAYDNLEMQRRILGVEPREATDEILDTVGLKDAGGKKAKDFSLGMKQRLGIGIALIGNPDFLILDEPTNGLDPGGIIEIRELLIRLNRDKGITMLVSSHILSELSKFATTYGFIDSGTLLKEISAAELEGLCRRCARITVDTSAKLPAVFEETLGIADYKILSATEAEVYDPHDITELAIALKNAGISLKSYREQDENLESYYINLVGGARHD